jgi:hypothetical protein
MKFVSTYAEAREQSRTNCDGIELAFAEFGQVLVIDKDSCMSSDTYDLGVMNRRAALLGRRQLRCVANFDEDAMQSMHILEHVSNERCIGGGEFESQRLEKL